MSEILVTKQSTPTTPATGSASIFVDSVTGKLASVDNSGTVIHYDRGWYLIEEISLTAGDQASIDFQNIPQVFKHLKILFEGRSTRAGTTSDSLQMKLNNDAGNMYIGMIQWNGQSGKVEQATAGAPLAISFVTANNSPADYYSNTEITLFNYTDAVRNKTFQARGMQILTNAGGNFFIYDAMGMYLTTTVVSRVTLYATNGNLKQYSKATLYGLR